MTHVCILGNEVKGQKLILKTESLVTYCEKSRALRGP